MERALCGLTPLTFADLRRQTGDSYQAADAALIELQKLDVVSGDGDGRSCCMGCGFWRCARWLASTPARKAVCFVDPTGNGGMLSAMADCPLCLRSRWT